MLSIITSVTPDGKRVNAHGTDGESTFVGSAPFGKASVDSSHARAAFNAVVNAGMADAVNDRQAHWRHEVNPDGSHFWFV